MARNTIVAVLIGVNFITLLICLLLKYIDGETFTAAVTGVTSIGTILIGVYSKDNKDTNYDN